MPPDYKKNLKKITPEKKGVKISAEERAFLEQHSHPDEPQVTPEQKTVLDILTKRKTVNMIAREYNLALRPLGKDLISEGRIQEILGELKEKNLVKVVTGGDDKEYWVDIKHFREKLFGTDKL
jgi:RNA-binding protein YhbY